MNVRYLPPEEVAAIFGITVKGLYNWRYRGVGPKATPIEGHLRYSEQEVKDYIKRQEAAS